MVSAYITALKNEIYRWGANLMRPADTVYFGGGTPSVLSAEELCEILLAVKEAFCVTDDAEITVEINPENANEEFFSRLKYGGFNRLSIGVQSLCDDTLKIIGRGHTAQQAVSAVKLARKAGFDNISLDVMLGLPNESVEKTTETVSGIAQLSPEHISCYMLILEEKTALFAKKDLLSIPNEEQVSSQYENVCQILNQNGYSHYEISNFSKIGDESRHNLKYWNDEEYIGIGPSAYSFVDKKRFHYENNLHAFIKAPVTVSDGAGGDFYEYIMLKLRLSSGINEEEIKRLYFKKFSNKFYERANLLRENGFANFENGSFVFTDKGMLVSNTLICDMTEEDMYENL